MWCRRCCNVNVALMLLLPCRECCDDLTREAKSDSRDFGIDVLSSVCDQAEPVLCSIALSQVSNGQNAVSAVAGFCHSAWVFWDQSHIPVMILMLPEPVCRLHCCPVWVPVGGTDVDCFSLHGTDMTMMVVNFPDVLSVHHCWTKAIRRTQKDKLMK